MKKIAFFLFGMVLLPLGALAQGTIIDSGSADPFPGILKFGDSGNAVKELQLILKNDTVIYPEGITSGYYGSLTVAAIKRLQRRYGLSETGVFDEATQEALFPTKTRIDIDIFAPNGNEAWDKSQAHDITWEVTIGPVVIEGRTIVGETASTDTIRPLTVPFFPYASIDLIRDSDPRFRYHIGSANLYTAKYTWRIPADIPTGTDYRVEMGIGGNVPCLYRAEREGKAGFTAPCPAGLPYYSQSDTSDAPFKIEA
ncbi:MAG: hypothetical protein A2847_00675 [Candidatus Sungbacteria bacterium RIFCSPHIGHO2_01_FULL_50_25]|uniref:Peptidoglycan binding-like domain-containing protein n=1 Tax=Candidatus Sungbacteria bacterium RIFCSPHIGHO2_01_FULL_50_25 TaxID=1802265 RepID=A0A1G2KCM3_9BACT|nr:MAG: hypothetical protein A2847_00675 [Candidatus Sungbacteria bacterium RIFCSPHIGHO2_01_FULL_50_25]